MKQQHLKGSVNPVIKNAIMLENINIPSSVAFVFVFINDKYLLEEYVTEEEKKIAFEHIDSCRCGGGPKKMFGEDVEWCCGTNFRFNVPTIEELPFMKKMVLLKMMEIDEK